MKKYMLVPVTEEQNQQVASQQQQVLPPQQQAGLSQLDVLSAVPVSYRNKARTLLDCIIKSSQLTWNDRGEIVLGDDTVHGSHIIDLLKYTLHPYKHFTPVGVEQFNDTLRSINVPRSLINQSGRGALLPPPGLPDKKPTIKTRNKSPWAWHKM